MSFAASSSSVRQVTVRTVGPGQTEILLDGNDVSEQLAAVNVEHVAGEIPVVTLVLAQSAEQRVDFDGLARVQIGEPANAGDAAAQFLAAIDAGALERAALQHPELAAQGGTTKMILRLLQEWARGD